MVAWPIRHVQGPPRDGPGRGMQQACWVLGLEHVPVGLHTGVTLRVSGTRIQNPGVTKPLRVQAGARLRVPKLLVLIDRGLMPGI